MKHMSLVVLTGASGSGKTTIALLLQRAHPEFAVFRFDTIGVPSAEVMASFGEGHQPGGSWQRAMTREWVARIAGVVGSGRGVLFEGQMRIAFIREALAEQNLTGARVMLADCDDVTRTRRLTHDRTQPELADENMMGWARYLRDEAAEAGYEVLDTGRLTPEQSVAHIADYLAAG